MIGYLIKEFQVSFNHFTRKKLILFECTSISWTTFAVSSCFTIKLDSKDLNQFMAMRLELLLTFFHRSSDIMIRVFTSVFQLLEKRQDRKLTNESMSTVQGFVSDDSFQVTV